jgi:hypothetical protein
MLIPADTRATELCRDTKDEVLVIADSQDTEFVVFVGLVLTTATLLATAEVDTEH